MLAEREAERQRRFGDAFGGGGAGGGGGGAGRSVLLRKG